MSISGTFAAKGVSAFDQALADGDWTITISGSFVGIVEIEKSRDNFSWVPVRQPPLLVAGTAIAQTINIAVQADELIRLNCLGYTSGTLTYSAQMTTGVLAPLTNPLTISSFFNKSYVVPASASVSIAVPGDILTLDAALAAIAQWIIPSSATVTINLPSGSTARATPIVFSHPYGSRIVLQGVTPVTTTASAAGAVTGSAGAWAVPLTVNSATNIAIGDYALVRNVTGTGQYLLFSGICRVSNVAGSVVTVTNTARNAAWPTAALSTADITVLKSYLSFIACDGIQVNSALGTLNNLALIGTNTAGTIGLISQRVSAGMKGEGFVYCGSAVGISNFGDGGIYALANGTVIAPSICVAASTVYGVYGQQGGHALVDSGVISGCQDTGIGSASSGSVSAEGAIAVGNGVYGAYSFQGGTLLLQNGFFWSNVSDGIRWAWGGSGRGTGISAKFNGGNGVMVVGGHGVIASSTMSNNTGAGAYVEGGGSCYASGSTMSSNGTYGGYVDGGILDAPSAVVSSNTINGITVTNNGTALVDGLSGTANGTYLVSATNGGTARATNAVTAGATVFANSGGLVDLTSATGSPVLSYSPDSIIIGTGGVATHGAILIVGTSNLAIGATNAAGINMDKTGSSYLRMARSGTVKSFFGIDDGGALVVGALAGDTIIRAEQDLWITGGGANPRGFVDALGNASLGRPSLGTTATDGFLYVPACAGPPTGVPTAKTGLVPIVVDSTNNKAYIRSGGAWVALN